MPFGAVFADLGLPPDIPFLNWPWDDLLFLILSGIMLGSALFVGRIRRREERPERG